MNVLKTVSGLFDNKKNDIETIISEHGFQVAKCEPEDCEACSRFPSSVKVEGGDKPMWGATQPWDLHILIATGKHDWIRDPADEKGSIAAVVSSSIDKIGAKIPSAYTRHGSTIKMSTTSMPTNDDGTADILILPIFKRVQVTASNAVDQICQALQGSTGQTDESKGYILLCSHKTRDKRCGITAPIMKKQFDIELRHHDLHRDTVGDDRPGGVRIVFINHVGGHKFNANVFVYTKNRAVWMARVNPTHVKAIVEKTVIDDKVVFPDLVRQCLKW